MTYRDFYLTVSDSQEFGEAHIWATQEQVDRLKQKLTNLMEEYGYPQDEIEINCEDDAEYDWSFDDEPDEPGLEDAAREILDTFGFTRQPCGQSFMAGSVCILPIGHVGSHHDGT